MFPLTPLARWRSMESEGFSYASQRGVSLRGKRFHILTLLLAVNYLLALTAGPSLHNHGDRRCNDVTGGCVPPTCDHLHACGEASGHSHASPCGDETASPQHGGRETRSLDSHNAECPVCQFLAQKPIPPTQVAETFATRLGERLAPSTRPGCAGEVPSSYRVRAPPGVA